MDSQYMKIPVAAILPNPDQPRTHFNEESLKSLASSIDTHGLLQPIEVEPGGDGTYILHHGERRLRAVKLLEWQEIPAIISDVLVPKERLIRALIENMMREDVGPIQEALAFLRLKEEHGMSQIEISRLTGRRESTISNRLAWLKEESELVRWLVDSGQLPVDTRVREALATVPLEDREAMAPRLVGLSIKGIQKAVQVYHKARAKSEEARQEKGKTAKPAHTNGAGPHPQEEATEEPAKKRPGKMPHAIRIVLGNGSTGVGLDDNIIAAFSASCAICPLSRLAPENTCRTCPSANTIRALTGRRLLK